MKLLPISEWWRYRVGFGCWWRSPWSCKRGDHVFDPGQHGFAPGAATVDFYCANCQKFLFYKQVEHLTGEEKKAIGITLDDLDAWEHAPQDIV